MSLDILLKRGRAGSHVEKIVKRGALYCSPSIKELNTQPLEERGVSVLSANDVFFPYLMLHGALISSELGRLQWPTAWSLVIPQAIVIQIELSPSSFSAGPLGSLGWTSHSS